MYLKKEENAPVITVDDNGIGHGMDSSVDYKKTTDTNWLSYQEGQSFENGEYLAHKKAHNITFASENTTFTVQKKDSPSPAVSDGGGGGCGFITMPNQANQNKKDEPLKKDEQQKKTAGYIKGYNDNTFRPNQKLTRAEAVAILNKVFSVQADDKAPTFSDVPKTFWAYDDIKKASN